MGGIVKSAKKIAGGEALSLLGDILGGGGDKGSTEPTPAPVVEPPTPMPTADDAAVRKARKRSIAQQISRRGRASTILTGNDDGLGG